MDPTYWRHLANTSTEYFIQTNETKNFYDARQICQDFGGILASVTSGFVQVFLESIIPMSVSSDKAGNRSYWIGASRNGSHSPWTWEDNITVVYSNWAPNESNQTDENCANIKSDSQHKWYSSHCEFDQYKYICEREIVNTTTTAANLNVTTTPAPSTTFSPTLNNNTTAAYVGSTAYKTTTTYTTSLPTDTDTTFVTRTTNTPITSPHNTGISTELLIIILLLVGIFVLVVISSLMIMIKRRRSRRGRIFVTEALQQSTREREVEIRLQRDTGSTMDENLIEQTNNLVEITSENASIEGNRESQYHEASLSTQYNNATYDQVNEVVDDDDYVAIYSTSKKVMNRNKTP
uniref:lymphocyte antigen 75-like isoform X2 n=1 Tax=Ciona intestinalis TaxID=7719 RepID=UPI00089DD677|nr:lymphocyte antigen 75-like isoform X2 [Ciona intestinalis]|eukprot:XP_018668631.1 lymphocyte antigen 75-like isoform X2 [Ciona intestinalis]